MRFWPFRRRVLVSGPDNVRSMDESILMLDPDESQFVTMMQKLSQGHPTTRLPWSPGVYVGMCVYDASTDKKWVVRDIVPEDPDDWMNVRKVCVCWQPWHTTREATKVEWLEDEFLPGFA